MSVATAGLSAEAVRERRASGQVNGGPPSTSRTFAQILRANVLTRFNAILGALLVVIIVIGPFNDALFGIVLIANVLIGVVQELRARRMLDRLALVHAAKAQVWRGGDCQSVPVEDVVLDDLLEVGAGSEIVVDGQVVEAEMLEVDESLLTGEADPIVKLAGDEVLSGSFVVAGEGRYVARRVGADAYAARLAAEARQFSLVRSELRAGIDTILRIVTWLIGPTAAILVTSELVRNGNVKDALRGSIAGIGSMIPEGLVLLTSMAFAVGAVRLGRRRVLVQELAAVEVLARVDTVCMDKTGTITEPELQLTDVTPLDGVGPGDVAMAVATIASAEAQPNASLRAISAALPAAAKAGGKVTQVVAFSSARRWSGAVVDGDEGWVLGAPDVLLPAGSPVRERAEATAASGARVLLVARTGGRLPEDGTVPEVDRPLGLLTLSERVRPEAPATLAYFEAQGVDVKLISGDHPRTVAFTAAGAGLDIGNGAMAGPDLPSDPGPLADAVREGTVFGRVDPHQKRAMIEALQSQGRVVAMIGDGVNDVLALKQADLGVAMGSGTAASRGVAQLVLLDGSFAVLPSVVDEGRRVIGNVERVANLFLTKTVYALLLSLAVSAAGLPFPFLPRQLTVISTLTIGVPAFFLALAPGGARHRPGLVWRVLTFAIPAGMVAAAATFVGYALASTELDAPLANARTAATISLFGVAYWVLAILARPLTPRRRGLLAAMVGAFVLALTVPSLRRFYALDAPAPFVLAASAIVVVAANVVLELGWRMTAPWRSTEP